MLRDRLESWKRSPPASAEEEAAAELLKRVGEAEALSPQAMHRVERRLRAPAKPRLPLFADARFAIAAMGGVLSLVAIAVVGIQFVDLKGEPTAATHALRQEPALARAEAPAPVPTPSAPPSASSPSSPPSSLGAPTDSAQPPSGWTKKAREPSAKLAAKEASKPVGQVGLGAPPAADRAEAMSAPAAASAAPSEGRRALESDALSLTSSDRCRAEIPGLSATLANNSGEVERALFERGRCWLKLGNREAGLADLRAYLARFPSGRFVAQAHQLLGEVGARP